MTQNTNDKTPIGDFAMAKSDAELFFYAGKDYYLRPDIYPDFRKQWSQYLKLKKRVMVYKPDLIECIAEAALAFFPSSDIESSVEFAVYVFDKLAEKNLIAETRLSEKHTEGA